MLVGEKAGCLVCGRDLVCDDCHRLLAEEFVGKACLSPQIADPLDLAISLMRHPSVKMHGPEHHFLVPAVLLACYSIAAGRRDTLEGWLKKARDRAAQVKGGSCGAAVGTGIFMSVISGATPLSRREWRLANLMTSSSLHDIALAGGPRCCKRNMYLAILAATSFITGHLGVAMSVKREIACEFSDLNRECRREECPFYRKKGIARDEGH
jgi:hypothetical protein